MRNNDDKPPMVRTQQRQFRKVVRDVVYIVETLIPTNPGDPVCFLQEVHTDSIEELFVECV
jgi:hypothetical protein